jgi:hypothetical protein
VNTIGRRDVKCLINLFDSIVASVYRYAFGAWGPVAGKLDSLDCLFVQFITWVFNLPRNSCKNAILACFGRRCSQCDSLFLASVQLAKGFSSEAELWGLVTAALKNQTLKGSKWYKKVTEALIERGLKQEVWDTPTEVLVHRKEFGVKFSQYCFHNHLNLLRGNSADEIKGVQPFGIYPFLLHTNPGLSRFLFSFILSNWRWLEKGKCSSYPKNCLRCKKYNSSYHLLFECISFWDERELFFQHTGVPFEFEHLLVDDVQLAREAAILGKSIFVKISANCSMTAAQ